MKKILKAQLFVILLFCIFAFSACGAVDFKINFIVDGEIYTTVNTSGGETIKMPDNPTKDGFTFDGWFWDKDVWEKPFTANSLLDAPLSSDMRVYAKMVKQYIVSFNTDGGTSVISQQVEEGGFAIEPTTTKAGYTFNGWDYDFAQPITNNITVNASWTANADTPYKVEYYLENVNNNNYTLAYTENLTGTTDTTAIKIVDKTYEHFTIRSNTVSGNINGNGSTVLKVYYSRDKFTVIISSDNNCATLNKSFNGTYKYGYIIPAITVTVNLGYYLHGWYSDNELMTNNYTIPSFTVDKNINYVVNCSVKGEMSNFYFTSTANTCEITDVKDKTVKEITIPNYVTSIGAQAFRNYSSLTSIVISESAIDIGDYAFCNCSSLTSVTIPNSVTNIGQYAFYGCSRLTNATISDSVTNIRDYAFYECNRLTIISIPDSVTDIGKYTFYGCSVLTSVTIGNGVKSIGRDAFSGCSNLTNIYYTGTISKWASTIDGLYNIMRSSGITLYIDNEPITNVVLENITTINSYAFCGCSSLTSITIPNGVVSIGSGAFCHCTGLTSVSIPDSVTSIGSAFSDCSNLEIVTIGNNVTSIGSWAFRNCARLNNITIPDSVTYIGEQAFAYCSMLNSVTFKNVSGWKVLLDYASKPTWITTTDLLNASIAATYITTKYYNCYWQHV